jgi:hypothetical protein
LDDDLFNTQEQAECAKEWLNDLINKVIFDDKLKFKDHKHFAEKRNSLKKKLLECAELYEELGGDPSLIYSLPRPDLPGRKQWEMEWREAIEKDLISLGLSKTKAAEVAKEISSKAYFNIK